MSADALLDLIGEEENLEANRRHRDMIVTMYARTFFVIMRAPVRCSNRREANRAR